MPKAVIKKTISNKIPAGIVANLTPILTAKGDSEIEKKYLSLGGSSGFLGNATDVNKTISNGRYRSYQNGKIYWSNKTGAHEVHGSILQKYIAKKAAGGILGFPMSDEITGEKPGSRVSRFENGAIYWHPSTGAYEVHGSIFHRYLDLDGEAGFLGMPKSDETAVSGGRRSVFENGTIFWSSQTGAYEVHGAILQQFLKLGIAKMGFPISNEEKILKANGQDSGGRQSRFQHATIYWSKNSGAHEVHGSIRILYEKLGGPLGKMGYPLTDETKVPSTDIRYNNFQKGIIVWRPGLGAIDITSLKFNMDMVSCGQIDDGIDWGKWDKTPELITYLTFKVDNNILVNNERRPGGHGGTTRNINYSHTIPVVQSGTSIYWKVSVDDWDDWSSNDYLGRREETLNIRNLWGITGGSPPGVYTDMPAQHKGGDLPSLTSLKFDYSIQSVKPLDPNKHFREQLWWRFDNFKTANLSRQLFAETFKDVEHVDHWWDKLMSPVDWAIYESVYKGLAAKGNCFGMCLQALYSRANRSLLIEPIYEYKSINGDKTMVEENDLPLGIRQPINRLHGYQLGASAVGWYIARLATLDAIKPLATYERIKYYLDVGDYPIVSMFDLDGFRGHAVLPYGYQPGSGSQPHKIFVADPNVPWRTSNGDASYLQINKNNTFKFVTNNQVKYQSSAVLGGMLPGTFLLELPFHRVSFIQRTPFWEILLALGGLLGGALILLGDAESSQISAESNAYYHYQSGKQYVKANALPNFQRIPLMDYGDKAPEIYAQSGKFPNNLVQDIKGKRNGKYEHYLRNRLCGVHIKAPIITNAQDQLKMQSIASSNPYYTIQSTQPNKNIEINYIKYIDPFKGDYLKFKAELKLVGGTETQFGLDPQDQAVLLKPGGPINPISIIFETRTNGNLKSVRLSYTPQAVNELIKLKPQNWQSSLNSIVIERKTGLEGTVIDSKILPAQNINP